MPGWVIGSPTSFVGEGEVGAGEGADQSISASDSATLAEGPEIALAHAESGAIGETPEIALGQTDSGTAGEGQDIALAILDTGTLAETPAIALGDTDSGAAGETGSASEALDTAATDGGTLTEAGAISVTYPVTPQATPNFGEGGATRYPVKPERPPRTARVLRGHDWIAVGELARVDKRIIPLPDEDEDEMLILAALALV